MNIRPTRLFRLLVCLIFTCFLLVISCNKDTDLLLNAVLDKETTPVIDEESNVVDEDEDQSEQENVEEIADQSEDEVVLESRVTTFPVINDAYIQNGVGFNSEIVRLQENFRRSYLMFDLSPIDSIQGTITAATLEFIVNTDDGNGTIKVFKGTTSNWSENDLSAKSAPEMVTELGSIEEVYNVGTKVEIELKFSEISSEVATLILEHEDGNDLAFASKENKTIKGPKLVVTYTAPISSEAIVVDDNQVLEESEDETTEDETSNEETTEDETTEDDATEEDTAEEDTTEEDTTDNAPNSAPNALVEATPVTGVVPLEVSFSASKSSDDKEIVSYEWDFQNGSTSSSVNPVHTFSDSGSYEVLLKVTDAEGLNSTDTVTITVNEPTNEAPVAIASADITAGSAPLLVNFAGSNSTDDQLITRYHWNFKDGSTSDIANPTHTFNTPGTYNVDLIVYDAQGLSNTAVVTITVEENVVDNVCTSNGGRANDVGLKTWCWGDTTVPSGANTGRDGFSNGQLALDMACNGNMVTVEGDRLNFKINPTSPAAQGWCDSNFNYRAEIRTMPWNVDHQSGTEEWIGFNYRFGNNYKADPTRNWVLYQAHEGTLGAFPLLSLQINGVNTSAYRTGELIIVNSSQPVGNNTNTIYPTNFVPKAGESIDIVLHVIWGDNNTGLLEVWLNGTKALDLPTTRTVRSSNQVGGNSKFGIYYAPWKSQSGVSASAAAGITQMETSMGTLRILTRRPRDANYRQNSYAAVMPR